MTGILSTLSRRIKLFFAPGAAEQAMDSEMRYHIECEIAEHIKKGASPTEARRLALRDFGGIEKHKEAGRDARGTRLAEDFVLDLRYGARILLRNKSFTIAAVLTFALGVGSATAIFSVVRGVLLRPLPYRAPEQLVALWERNTARTGSTNVVAVASFEAWRERSHSFTDIAALIPDPVTITGISDPEQLSGLQVSPGYFSLLGVTPALGREFTAKESENGGASVVILSNAFWRSHFGGDSAVLGKALILDGKPNTIVGIMPATFLPPRFGWIDEQPFWVPFGATEGNRSWGHVLHVVARLRPNISIEGATADLEAIHKQLALEIPSAKGWSAQAINLTQTITGDVRAPLLLLLGGVSLLLLMSVVNVANLTLGLARRREPEFAVRRAIGASSTRLLRQLITQSVLLGVIGSAVGIAAGAFALKVLVAILPSDFPRTESISLDTRVLFTALGVAALSTIIVGIVAAFPGVRGNTTTLTPASSGSRVTSKLGGGTLVVAEIALATTLAILAGLMTHSFANLRNVNLGFSSENVVAGRASLSGPRYATPESQRAFFTTVLENVRHQPSVVAATIVNTRPFRCCGPSTSAFDPANPPAPGIEPPLVAVRFADSAVFNTLRIPLTEGHSFSSKWGTDGPPQAVITRSLAKSLGWTGPVVDHQLQIALNGGITAQVAGVIDDIHLTDVRTPARPAVYLLPMDSPIYDVIVRGSGTNAALLQALHDAIHAIDPTVPLATAAPLSELVDKSLARDRFITILLGAFSFVALTLAAVGIYGVFAADIRRRQREIGICIALGAGQARIMNGVLRRATGRAALGVGLGLAAAAVLTRPMATLLYGISPADPLAYGSVAVIMVAVAIAATFIPARRAIGISPLIAIRND